MSITSVATNATLHVSNTQLVFSALADHTAAVMWHWRSHTAQGKETKISPTTQTHNKSCNMHFLNYTITVLLHPAHHTQGFLQQFQQEA